MNSANAFSYAISGSFTEQSVNKYADYVNRANQALGQFGGWLGEQAAKNMTSLNTWLDSRAWEMGKRLLNQEDGEYVSRFSYGYLGSLTAQQNADGYMRDAIMANPTVQRLFIDGDISGYDGDFSQFARGIGAENMTYRRIMSGVVNLEMVDDVNHLRRTTYKDTLAGEFSFRERSDSLKTWAASNHHIASTEFDVTSNEGKKRKQFWEDEEA